MKEENNVSNALIENLVDQQMAKYDEVEMEMVREIDRVTLEVIQKADLAPYFNVPVQAACAFIGGLLDEEQELASPEKVALMESVATDLRNMLIKYTEEKNIPAHVVIEALPYVLHTQMILSLQEAITAELHLAN